MSNTAWLVAIRSLCFIAIDQAVLNASMLNLLNHRLVVGLSSASEP
jgi:hypothetical protein